MSGAFSKGWELAGVSARVLRADKELLTFPIVSAISVLLTTVALAVPAWILFSRGELQQGPIEAVATFTYYLVSNFIVTFFNAALCGAALVRLRGGDPTVMTGLRIAMSRIGVIFRFSLIAATVGLVMRALEGRNGRRTFLSSLIGAAWSVATFLVVPVMVNEEIGAIDAVKKSSSLLKKMWGDQLSGRITMGFIGFLGGFVLFALVTPLIYWAGTTNNGQLMFGSVTGFFVALGFLMLIVSTLNSIYASALYLHASGEQFGESEALALVKQALAR